MAEISIAEQPTRAKNAICLSTISSDGAPSGRFVDLKLVDEKGFYFCTYLYSKKARDLSSNNKAAITIWWDHVDMQVRISGVTEQIADDEADRFWQTRTKESQLTTICSKQSQTLIHEEQLLERLSVFKEQYNGKEIPRPSNWGGYRLAPDEIEFLKFNSNRLHTRELFVLNNGAWSKTLLQP